MVVILLFLSSSFHTIQATNWYYLHHATLSEQKSLYSTGCYHGTYGPISLLSCSSSQSNATFLKSLPEEDVSYLCVIQTSDPTQLYTRSTILHQLGDYYVLIPDSLSLCHEDHFITFGKRVSPSPVVPISPNVKYISVKGMAPDPEIVAALAGVDGSRMMQSITQLANFYTRNTRAYGAVQAQNYLINRFTNYGFAVSRFNYQFAYPNTSDVVIAELTGTDSANQIVVIGAHYDSRGPRNDNLERAPGANDDASGVSILLELARVIQSLGKRLSRTIRLCAFSGEEQGLLGSFYYAQSLSQKGENVVAMFNGDMLGWQYDNEYTLGMKRDYIDTSLLASANEITQLYVPDLGTGLSTSCCSDYVSFYDFGFPAIGYFQYPGIAADYPYYHTSNDLPVYIQPDLLELEGKAMIAAALTYAMNK